MLSTAVCFLTSSVDLFHRQAAGQWGAGRKGGLRFASRDMFNLQISICLSHPSSYITPHPLPQLLGKGFSFVFWFFFNPHIIIRFRDLDGQPQTLKEILKPLFCNSLSTLSLDREKNTVVAGDGRGGVPGGSFPDLSETGL